jgi:hypothetical protein
MGIVNPFSGPAERRRARRVSWAFNHALDAYGRTLSRLEREVGVLGDDPYAPMPRRAAAAMPRLRREHARFREAAVELDGAREAVLRRLNDPKTPADVAEAARVRFDALEPRRPTPEWIAQRELEWDRSLERLERWAQRDPEHAATLAQRRAARQLSARR